MIDYPPGPTPPLRANRDQLARLREYIAGALREQDDVRAALAAARRLDAGRWRVRSTFDVDEDGEIEVASLAYVVDLEGVEPGEWIELVEVGWRSLGLDLDQVLFEYRDVLRQRAEGTDPGGPNDPAT